MGVANYLARRAITDQKGMSAGKAFENFVLRDAEVAIEVKISSQVNKQDIKGLTARILSWEKFLNALWEGGII